MIEINCTSLKKRKWKVFFKKRKRFGNPGLKKQIHYASSSKSLVLEPGWLESPYSPTALHTSREEKTRKWDWSDYNLGRHRCPWLKSQFGKVFPKVTIIWVNSLCLENEVWSRSVAFNFRGWAHIPPYC